MMRCAYCADLAAKKNPLTAPPQKKRWPLCSYRTQKADERLVLYCAAACARGGDFWVLEFGREQLPGCFFWGGGRCVANVHFCCMEACVR